MNELSEPKLAPPGAGLPQLELRVARMLFALSRRRGNRETFSANFQWEREAINKLYSGRDAESGARRVLIARVRGLEDSSRYWSVWMTLDHLRIVNSGITSTIESLIKGVVPTRVANTAAVKPSPEASATVAKDYEASCDYLLNVVNTSADLNTPAKYAHPWFGPLNASGWHALAGNHMGIHREQIERILAGLKT